jgi:cytochrome c peroxidase
MMRHALAALVLASSCTLVSSAVYGSERWSVAETAELSTLWLGALEPLPADPTNRVASDPRAAELGQRLFFDTRLSANGKVSCASCHLPDREFQDGKKLGTGVGTTDRRTMPVAGTAYHPFLFWDGRKDSQWAQALGPLESPVEHGGTRAQYAHVIAKHYRTQYEAIFGSLPDLESIPPTAGPVADPSASATWLGLTDTQRNNVTAIFANIGKAIAAYERGIQYAPSRFDAYVERLVVTGRAPEGILARDEVAGLRLFIGKANCTQCHNGPLFTNHDFHNTGVPDVPSLPPDHGRTAGTKAVLGDEFNCRSRWSDAAVGQCSELEFLSVDAQKQERAFKAPSLRNVADRAPYMHAGQFGSLGEVLHHYNRAPTAPSGRTELKPLKLSARELAQLEAFLRTLSGRTTVPNQHVIATQ